MAPRNDEPGSSNALIDLDFLKKDDGNKEMLRQIAIGGGAGWLTGFISMKVGKVAATAVGGAMIILQVANHKGYIKINWNRVNHDVEKVKSKLKEEATGKKADWADKLEKKTTAIVNQQRRWFHSIVSNRDEDRVVREVAIMASSFVVGFGIGVMSGQ